MKGNWLETLPPDVRDVITPRIKAVFQKHNFLNYDQATADIHAIFEQEGIEIRPSRKSVWDVAQKHRDEIERDKMLQQIARYAAEAVGDDAGEVADHILRQFAASGLDILHSLQVNTENVSVSDFARLWQANSQAAMATEKIKRLRNDYKERAEKAAREVEARLKAAGADIAERLDAVLARHLQTLPEDRRQLIAAEVLETMQDSSGIYRVVTNEVIEQIRRDILGIQPD